MLTSVLQSHGLGERFGVTLESGDGLVVQPSDGLGEDVTRAGDAALVSRDQSGQEGFGETGQDLELASDGRVLQTGLVLGDVSGALCVDSQSVTLADLGASQLGEAFSRDPQ